ncbi:MAG: tetratricopeptide repeat protein, partial [Anaerolineae bacterium]
MTGKPAFIIKPNIKNYKDVNKAYNYLFNSYYNGIGEQFSRPQRGLISRLESLPSTAAGMENDTTSTAEDNVNSRTATSRRHFAKEDNPSVTTERHPHETISDTGTAISTVPIPDDFVMRVQKLAESGDAKAQSILGQMYATGDGVPENAAKAAEWFEKAAAQGDVEEQTVLGMMYRNDNGVPKNAATSAAGDSKSATE